MTSNESANHEAATDRAEQCARMLDNSLDAIAPGRYDISSDRRDVVSSLNNWREQCANPEIFTLGEDDAALRERYLTEDVYALTTEERFSDRDTGYVRDVMLARDLVNATLTDERSDQERAVSLFYKVVNTVDLRSIGGAAPILTPYGTAVFGWGSAADRAWLYGMMIRQLRLDAVVIRPRQEEGGPSEAWLIGVIVPEQGIYLFDFQMGLPVTLPSEDDGLPLPRNPVTLAQARQNDEVFRQYDLPEMTYPLSADQLKNVDVLAIGESSTWSPRLGHLQAALPEPLQIFDGLSANSFREHGLIERLVIAGQDGLWNEDAVGIWDYPETVYRNAHNQSPEQFQQLEVLGSILNAPRSVTIQQQGDQIIPLIEDSKQNLHLARIRHLKGDYKTALAIYLKARLADKHVMGRPIEVNLYGSDWSTYWASLAHFDQEDYSGAIQSSAQYLRSTGAWTTAAKVLQAKSLAMLPEPRFEEAADVLNNLPIRSPQRAGDQWLVRRWRRFAKSGSDAPAEDTAKAEKAETSEPTPAEKPDPATTEESEPNTVEEPPTNPETRPKQTPEDLPASEEPADQRFPEATDENESPADES